MDNRLEEFFSMVTYRGRKCELSVNLGGNAGPGSRPKGTKGTGYFFIQEENNMTVWEELKARGLIAQVTDEDEIKEIPVRPDLHGSLT